MLSYSFYIASTEHNASENWFKLGITSSLKHRLEVYTTGCPPISKYEMKYYTWKDSSMF